MFNRKNLQHKKVVYLTGEAGNREYISAVEITEAGALAFKQTSDIKSAAILKEHTATCLKILFSDYGLRLDLQTVIDTDFDYDC